MTLEVPYGVVIVTGAAATGKTTLARKLAKTAGRKGAAILSGKEIFETCRDPSQDDWEAQFCWRITSIQMILDAVKTGRSVVFEMQFPETERLNQFLMALRARDQNLPISLVKVTATADEQQQFAKNCSGVDERAITTSNRRFEEILDRRYSDDCNLARECVFERRMIEKIVFAA